METIVKLAVLRSGIKLGNSGDQILKKAIGELETSYRKYATSLGIAWPATLEEVEEARKKNKGQETEKWKQLRCQGQEVRDFRKDKFQIGNAWLYNITLLEP